MFTNILVKKNNFIFLLRKLCWLIVAALIFCAAQKPTLCELVQIKNAEYSFFTSLPVGELKNATVEKNGSGSIVTTNLQNISIGKGLQKTSGQSICFFGSKVDAEKLLKLLQAKVVFSEILQDIVCIYAYSPRLNGFVVADGEKINIQIALSQGKVHIGTPLLLGSY